MWSLGFWGLGKGRNGSCITRGCNDSPFMCASFFGEADVASRVNVASRFHIVVSMSQRRTWSPFIISMQQNLQHGGGNANMHLSLIR